MMTGAGWHGEPAITLSSRVSSGKRSSISCAHTMEVDTYNIIILFTVRRENEVFGKSGVLSQLVTVFEMHTMTTA